VSPRAQLVIMASDLHTLSDMNVLMKYADETKELVFRRPI